MMITKKVRILALIIVIIMSIELVPANAIERITSSLLKNNDETGVDVANNTVLEKEERVIAELPNERNAIEKHFLLNDGKVAIIRYDKDIHYLSNDKWCEIDNRLTYQEKKNAQDYNGYINTNNNFVVKFAESSKNDKLYTINEENYKITVGILSSRGSYGLSKNEVNAKIKQNSSNNKKGNSLAEQVILENNITEVTYYNIWNEVDIQYSLAGKSIKENIIINSKQQDYLFEFTLSLENLKAKFSEEDGSIVLYDPKLNDSIQYIIPAPYMYDANGKTSSGVKYELEESLNSYTLKVIADKEWIENQDTKFPVTIDPTLEKKGYNTYGIQDTYVIEGNPNSSSQCNYTILHVGYDSGSEYRRRIYIKYTNLPTLPESAVIVDSKFSYSQLSSSFPGYSGNDGLVLAAKEVTGTWNVSSLTWNTQPNNSGMILDYVTTSKDTALQNHYWNITSAVQNWYSLSNPNSNNGFVIMPDIEYKDDNGVIQSDSVLANVRLASSEASLSNSLAPSLQIIYRDIKGIEDYWTYHTFDYGKSLTGYINDYSGQLILENIDLISDENNVDELYVSHIYNGFQRNMGYSAISGLSSSASVGGTGHGWRLNLQERVYESSLPGANGITSYYFIHTDADGTDHYFYRGTSSSNLEATDEDGLGERIVKDSYGYKLMYENGTVKNFGTSGELKTIDKGICSYYIMYMNNKISSVFCYNEQENTLIEYFSFSYDSNGFISQITDNRNSKSVNFTYNLTGYLHSIQTSESETYSFLYISGRIYQIACTDVSLPKYIAYQSNGRVNLFYDYYYGFAGEEVVGIVAVNPTYISYKSHATFFQTVGGDGEYNTDDDIIDTYQFDPYGHTVNTYSNNKAKTEAYGSTVIKYCDGITSPDLIHTIQSVATDDGPVLNLADNPLLNNSFPPITQGVYTISTDNTTKYIGRNSIKISSSTSNTSVGIYSPSMVSHTSSRGYIVSFYIKTENVVGNGAYLRVSNPYYSSCNYESVHITGTTSADVNDGWQRVYMYIYLPIGSMYTSFQFILDSSVGTVWFDGFQLEIASTNSVCSELSLLTQGAPVYSLINSAWGKSNCSANYNYANTPLGDGYSFELKGLPKSTSYLRQTVSLDSNMNEVFAFSGFSKANSVKTINSNINRYDTTQRLYCVGAIITLSDGVNTITQEEYTPLNCDITDWQTFTHLIAVDKTDLNITSNMRIISITVEMLYQCNVNKAYFTQLCLTHSSSVSLCYGEDGKIIGINTNGSSVEYIRDENGELIQEAVSDKYVRDGNIGTTLKSDGSSVEQTYITINDEEVEETRVYINQAGAITKKVYKIYDSNRNVSRLVEKKSDFEISNYLNEDVNIIIDYTYISYLDEDGETKYLVSSVSEKDGSLNSLNLTNYSYDTYHNVSAKTYYDFEGSHYSYSAWTYDSDGNLLSSTDELGNRTSYTYDNEGNVLSETKPNGTKIGYIYDTNGNLTSCYYDADMDCIFDPSETGLVYDYNLNNQLVSINANTDYIFIYDRFENLRKISIGDFNNNQELVSYTYQYSTSRLQTTEYVNGWLQRYVYDNNDNVVKIYYSNTRESISEYLAHEWIYSIKNVLFKYIDYENGRVYYYEHDDDGKVLRTIVCDINTEVILFKVEYVYMAGELTSYRYIYANNVVEEISFMYNDNNGIRSYTKGLGNITFEYDTIDRLVSKAIEFANHTLTNQYTYAKTQPLLSTNSVISSITLADGIVYSYNYDSNGNITEVYENSILKQSYVYDALDQLTRENNAYANRTYVWAYDNGGNILNKKVYQYTTGSLGTILSTSSYGYTDTIWKDKLTSYNGIPITYDGNGNPLSYYNGQQYTFTWSNGRELASTLVGSTSVSYTYDAYGFRNSKTVNSIKHTYLVDGSKIIQERYGSNVLFYYYDETDSIMGLKYNESKYLFEKNLQGDVIKIYNESGVVVCNYTYDAWGKVISITGSESAGIGVINPFRYRGYYYDSELEFYYLQSRYYDPVINRFINADDMKYLGANSSLLGFNLFTYCDNNPIKYIDPTGNLIWQGQVHSIVQMYMFCVIWGRYGKIPELERRVKYRNKFGIPLYKRIDIYLKKGKDIWLWEVKPNKSKYVDEGLKQLKNYISLVKGSKPGKALGEYTIYWPTNLGIFKINIYSSFDDGMIYYDYKIDIESTISVFLVAVGIALTVTGVFSEVGVPLIGFGLA